MAARRDQRRIGSVTLLLASAALALAAAAPQPSGESWLANQREGGRYDLEGTATQRGGSASTREGQRGPVSAATGPAYQTLWVPACAGNFPQNQVDALCTNAYTACPQNQRADAPGAYLNMRHYRREVDRATGAPVPGPAGAWALAGTECRGPADDQPQQGPSLPELVLREWRSIKIPAATAIAQPPGRTLVNLPTIFHTTTGEQAFPVTLLGRDVVLHAIPVTYRWTFAPDATATTRGPGAPWPSKEITHTYTDTGATRVRVDVTYRAEYTVDGGPRLPVPGQTTVTGTTEPLRILQARTRLVDND